MEQKEKEKRNKKIEKKVKAFMKATNDYLKSKNGGVVPAEYICSLELLREYYKLFVELTEEISSLDSLVFVGRYGPQPSPLLTARDKACIRLESMMKELGLTFKSQKALKVSTAVAEESPLEKWTKGKIEKR